MDDAKRRDLLAKAIEARKKAYSKYSHFPVGAALLCRDGTIVTGCNVENAVHNLGLCAERTAVVKAVSDGHTDFIAVSVITNCPSFVSPCGACRQVLSEFSSDGSLEIIMGRQDTKDYEVTTISDLLPRMFSSEKLDELANVSK